MSDNKEQSANAETKTVRLKINGEEVEAPLGEMLIKTCHDHGFDVPYFCYHPGLQPEGNCRMCLVEASNARKPVPACMTPVTEGIEVQTHSEPAKDARADVLEFMLSNHPLDCPICDKSGECMLQDNSFGHGKDGSRMVDKKELKHTKPLGNDIRIWGNRCISCTRCVRFCNDIAGTGELTMVNRGDRSVVDVFPDYPLQNPISGNVVDLCPVGALISEDFLYEARVWYEKRTNSVCHECARGCAIEVQTLHNKVKRIVARENPEVNDHWICDHGRFTYDYVLGPDRWLQYRFSPEGRTVNPATAGRDLGARLGEALENSGASSVGILASSFSSNETLLLLRELLETLGAPADQIAAWSRTAGEEQTFEYRHRDGRFRISADRNPNRAGAELLLGDGATGSRLDALESKAKSGALKVLLAVSDIPGEKLPQVWVDALNSAELGVVLLLEADERLDPRVVTLPATAFVEREGSIVNEDGQLQLVEAASQLPRGILQTHDLLQDLNSALNTAGLAAEGSQARKGRISSRGLFEELASAIPALEGIRRADVGKHGIRLSKQEASP